jgi:hypothetical protein
MAINQAGIIIGGRLNVRKKPSVQSKRIDTLPEGSLVIVSEYDALWYQLHNDSDGGYIMKAFVKLISNSIEKWEYGKTKVDSLNVRQAPGISALRWNSSWPKGRIALIKPGVEGWFETRYRGEVAYISAQYVIPLAVNVSKSIVDRMLYMVAPEVGRSNSRYFNGYTGQWCHRFADWLAMHAGTPKNLIPNTSNCGKGIVWFVNDAESGGFYFKNAEHKARMISNYSTIRHLPKELTEEEAAYIPSPGDYIYFRWRNAAKDVNVSHVGIVSGVSEDKLTTVEGNAGGAVANRSYALNDDRIVGYGKPRYDAVG